MSGVYLIRNPSTQKWLSDNYSECEKVEGTSCRYWSEKAARKAIKNAVSRHKDLNDYYEENPDKKWANWQPYPEHYEVVAFQLVEVGSLG
ncbi:MAG: hypothetical protein EOQ89_03580 [Mesorhizobium sp.]|nr:MAG: hypothetical protein EOQ89_03580 [Mesorhizobium sp.]